MKKKFFSFIGGLCAIACVLFSSKLAWGYSSGTVTSYLPTNSMWVQAVGNFERNTAYSTVYLRVISVAPPTGNDTYTRCKFRGNPLTNWINIIDPVILTEGHAYDLRIKEGYLDIGTFRLYASGNSPTLDAYVIFQYDGNRRVNP